MNRRFSLPLQRWEGAVAQSAALNLDGYEIVLSPLELAAILIVVAVLFMIAGSLLKGHFDVTVTVRRRRPPDDPGGGGWPVDGPDPDDPVLTAEWPWAPAELVPDSYASDRPMEVLSWADWPLEPRDPHRPRRGRHRLRTGAVYYRPAGVS